MSEKDRFGWPIRMVNGVRLCAREGCEDDEFRIDGYCSMECRDVDEVEIEFRAYRADVEPVLRSLIDGLRAVEGLINDSHGVDGLHLNGDVAPWDELRTGGAFEDWLKDFDAALAAVSASRVCKRIAKEEKK